MKHWIKNHCDNINVDEIFRQNLELADPPGWASAYSPEVFKVTNTTHSSYFGKVHRGPGFFTQIGEVTTVPTYQGTVANKYTVIISPFAESIDISKDLVDDKRNVSQIVVPSRYLSQLSLVLA